MNGRSTVFLIAVSLGGCAANRLPPYDPSKPVELDGYQQEGRAIDPQSLKEGLSKEDGPKELVDKSQTISVPALILAGVGGALIGWPLGEAASGSSEPKWILAGVGGGVAAAGLGLGLWADAVFRDAVKTHNGRVGTRQEPSAQWRGNSFKYTW